MIYLIQIFLQLNEIIHGVEFLTERFEEGTCEEKLV